MISYSNKTILINEVVMEKLAEKKKIHVFEEAGHGKAPYSYHGAFYVDKVRAGEITSDYHKNIVTEHFDYLDNGMKGLCNCHFCGTEILYHFKIMSSDRHKFIVGSTCIYKTGDSGLINYVKPAKTELERVQKERKKQAAKGKRLIRETKKIEQGKKLLTNQSEYINTFPHPNNWYNSQGKTFFDYCGWIFNHAGNSTKISVTNWIKRRIVKREKAFTKLYEDGHELDYKNAIAMRRGGSTIKEIESAIKSFKVED